MAASYYFSILSSIFSYSTVEIFAPVIPPAKPPTTVPIKPPTTGMGISTYPAKNPPTIPPVVPTKLPVVEKAPLFVLFLNSDFDI